MTTTETIEWIKNAVVEVSGLEWSQIISKSRKQDLVDLRMMFCYIVRKETKYPLTQLGKDIGDRDHTTVIHGVQTVQGFLDIKDRPTTYLYKRVVRVMNRTKPPCIGTKILWLDKSFNLKIYPLRIALKSKTV